MNDLTVVDKSKHSWFDELWYEDDIIICIKDCKDDDSDAIYNGQMFGISPGCITLHNISTYPPEIGLTCYLIGNVKYMPTKEWFFNHFAICS